jgi:hypothetical protein
MTDGLPARCVAAALVASIVVYAGCNGAVTPEVVAGVDVCRHCNMVIDQPRQACGYPDDGVFVTFDSPVCLLREYETLAEPPEAVYFADYESGALHAAERVTFLLTDHVRTAMEGGVLCFADREAAKAVRTHDDERLSDWAGFRLLRGEPDRVIEVRFGPAGMDPEVVQADKGDLLLWRARSDGLERDLVVSVLGYPELAAVTVPASGEEAVFRLQAARPGAGFPVLGGESAEPLGMLKVAGAHTTDEEAM